MRRKDDGKQKSIKDAVIKLILEEGFHGTSMSKIAREAGLSPATVYIYYANKEVMLQEIYLEYSEEVFYYLLNKIHADMDGRLLVETLIRSYYTYIQEHDEVFHFIEQFSSCPALASQCGEMKGIYSLYEIFEKLKERGTFKGFRNDNLLAVIFSPVKAIAINHCSTVQEREEIIGEIIQIIQGAVLK